jgi:hypothetical protein
MTKHKGSKVRGLLLSLAFPLISQAATVVSSTDNWTVIQYPNGPSTDAFTDQQTGDKEGDIVGNSLNPSLYKMFDDNGTVNVHTDGTLSFRVRIAAEANPPGFQGAFYVGMDVNNDGAVDLFAGAINKGSVSIVGYFTPTGTANSPGGSNINDSTPFYSEAITATNYNWQGVTTGVAGNDPSATTNDVDGGGKQDFFLSLALPFNQAVAALNALLPGFNDLSSMTFIAATSQNANSINQDLNMVNGNITSTSSFKNLGAVSLLYSSIGTAAIPEPTSAGLLLGGALVALARRRRAA